jgi:DNA-binding response OmpR family regulator
MDGSLAVGPLELRPGECQAFAEGLRTHLTVREFQVLLALAERPDRVVPRADVYQRVWGGTMPRRDRSVDVFVRKVRRKLEAVSPGWSYVHTHFGIGYRLAPEPRPGFHQADTSGSQDGAGGGPSWPRP